MAKRFEFNASDESGFVLVDFAIPSGSNMKICWFKKFDESNADGGYTEHKYCVVNDPVGKVAVIDYYRSYNPTNIDYMYDSYNCSYKTIWADNGFNYDACFPYIDPMEVENS